MRDQELAALLFVRKYREALDRRLSTPKISPHSLKLRFDVRMTAPFSYRALISWKNRLAPFSVSGR